MSDRDLKNWDQRLRNQARLGWDNYVRRRINLDNARLDELLTIAGEYIYVEEVSSSSAAASLKLNRNTNDSIDLIAGVTVETIFTDLYITNTAQAGEWIDLLIGINFKYRKPFAAAGSSPQSEAQSVVPLTHANPNTNVTPAARICNAACIKADVNNTQTVWIDFGTAAVQNACLPLDPGESVSVNLSNLNRINANFEVGGEYVFIVYEV